MPNRRARELVAALRRHPDLPHVLVVGHPAMADALAVALHREAVRGVAGMVAVPGADEEAALAALAAGAALRPDEQVARVAAVRAWLKGAPACIDGRRRTALRLRVSDACAAAQACLKSCCEGPDAPMWVMSASGTSRVSEGLRGMCLVVGAEPEAPREFATRAKPGLPDSVWDSILRAAAGRSVATCLGGVGGAEASLSRQMAGAIRAFSESGGAAAALRAAASAAVGSGAPSGVIAACLLQAARRVSGAGGAGMPEAAEAAARLDAGIQDARRTVVWPVLVEAALVEAAAALFPPRAAEPPASPSPAAAGGKDLASVFSVLSDKGTKPPPPAAQQQQRRGRAAPPTGGKQATLDLWMKKK